VFPQNSCQIATTAHAAKKREDEAFFLAPGIFFSSVAGGLVSVF
jgi:hypothetical protein